MKLPVTLNPGYTCQGTDADGKSVTFDDLLSAGDTVDLLPTPENGPQPEDGGGVVIERDGELVIVERCLTLTSNLFPPQRCIAPANVGDARHVHRSFDGVWWMR